MPRTAARKTPEPILPKKPSARDLDALKRQDQGYVLASENAVRFLQGRKQAIFNISRQYHLDPEELLQEGYEVLLTCLRDFTPMFEKEPGKFITVQFTTFFGSRMDSRAMEMRNRDPEYQARQAFTEGMSDDERARFRSDPSLLVHHLDSENPMQESLRGEVSEAREVMGDESKLRVARDSFFERKLNELVARETDDKKRAALLHVKVGGIYNFQDIAWHFGVTDSRASQILNELMDAFYVQRLIDGDLPSVAYDFKKLKFTEKRAQRLLLEALVNVNEDRAGKILQTFNRDYETLEVSYRAEAKRLANNRAKQETLAVAQGNTGDESTGSLPLPVRMAYEDIFTDEEEKTYPLVGVEVRSIDALKFIELAFRPPVDHMGGEQYAAMAHNPAQYPALVTEDGWVLDGVRRILAAKAQGKTEYVCITRRVDDDHTRKVLRVAVNMRLAKPDKTEMYFAIGALADMGLSQQKIADALGTSRTNVIVYAKVREKAAPKLRALFEDGLIQITNASACTDFSETVQGEVADFIRKYGPEWSKGSHFNELQAAGAENRIAELVSQQAPHLSALPEMVPQSAQQTGAALAGPAAMALQRRLEQYEIALKDAEIWNAQRESVIAKQTEEITESRSHIEGLKREVEALELMRFGDKGAMEEALKEMKQFFAVTERMAGAAHNLAMAAGELRRVELKRKQMSELTDLMDTVEKHLNTLRLELLNKTRLFGRPEQSGEVPVVEMAPKTGRRG